MMGRSLADHMTNDEQLPTGRLQKVERNWEYRNGWVRAPLVEIVFNARLTKQARLLWLWLAAIHPNAKNISWAECENVMGCGTKARRNCLSQLVQEGFVTVEENGTVIVHDPYVVYMKNPPDFIPQVKFEFTTFDEIEYESTDSQKNAIANVCIEPSAIASNKNAKEKNKSKDEFAQLIIESWNTNKPESYSKMRTVSARQMEAISKHLKNLSCNNKDIDLFISTVCNGIKRSDFWTNKVDQSGRNFSAVFGYGNPHDTKLRNVENLYLLGQEDCEPIENGGKLTSDQNELMRTYRFIFFEYEKALNRNNQADISRYGKNLEIIKQQLQDQNIIIAES